MTYVLGVRRRNLAAIFSDSLLSVSGSPWHVGALKNGVLFDGCIFGAAADDWDAAAAFVSLAHKACRDASTLQERWEVFEKVCLFHNISGGPFELLLSTRCFGEPAFFHYYSVNKLLRRGESDFYALGSGVSTYEDLMTRFDRDVLTSQQVAFAPGETWPYRLSAVLHETLIPVPNSRAGAAGVGGPVSFATQDALSELRQEPCLYVLLLLQHNRRSALVNFQRIACEHHPEFGDALLHSELTRGGRRQWKLAVQHPPVGSGRSMDIKRKALQAWLDELIRAHTIGLPYHFLHVSMFDVRYYAPFVDVREDDWFVADGAGYLDPKLFESQMSLLNDPPIHANLRNRLMRLQLDGFRWLLPN